MISDFAAAKTIVLDFGTCNKFNIRGRRGD